MRIRRVSSQQEMERAIDDYITQGYKVQARGESNAKLKQNNWGSGAGHFWIALFTVWWTFGFGNLIYALVKNSGGDQVMVKMEDEAQPT